MKTPTRYTLTYIIISIFFIFSMIFIVRTINHINDVKKQNELLTGKLDTAKTTIELLDNQKEQLEFELTSTQSELEETNLTMSELKSEEYKFVYMGEFKLTHYCTELYEHICGTGDDLTSTGTKVTHGRTIAVDPSIIPYGTNVYIEGYGFRTAEDCGGAVKGQHIDIAVGSHLDALSMGTKMGGVWMVLKKAN